MRARRRRMDSANPISGRGWGRRRRANTRLPVAVSDAESNAGSAGTTSAGRDHLPDVSSCCTNAAQVTAQTSCTTTTHETEAQTEAPADPEEEATVEALAAAIAAIYAAAAARAETDTGRAAWSACTRPGQVARCRRHVADPIAYWPWSSRRSAESARRTPAAAQSGCAIAEHRTATRSRCERVPAPTTVFVALCRSSHNWAP